jgi:2-hydroxychromene-2-carboxylate isomerase
MTTTIEIFYTYLSPHCYLALDALYDMQRDYELELIWQPFSAKAAGQQPPSVTLIPEKLSYILESTQRYARETSIPLTFPPQWPQEEYDPSKITRGALVARDMDVMKEYNYKVFYKIWGLGENPNDESFLNELCDELDVDLGEFLSKMSSSDTRERVKNIYKRGRKLEVFDTPTFVIENERYVGLDSIDSLKRRFASGKKKSNVGASAVASPYV